MTNTSISYLIASKNSFLCIKECLSILISLVDDCDEILICDASTDDLTKPYLHDMEKKYNCLKVFDGTGQGIYKDRLLLISHAKKEYIYFIDSDDLVLKKIDKQIFEEKPDVIFVNSLIRDKSKEELFNPFDRNDVAIVSKHEVIKIFLTSLKLNPLWCAFIKKSIAIDSIRDLSSISMFPNIGEDRFIMSTIISKSSLFIYSPEIIYLYKISVLSTTSQKKQTFFNDCKILLQKNFELLISSKTKWKEYFGSKCCHYYVFSLIKYLFAISKKREEFKIAKDQTLLIESLKTTLKNTKPRTIKEFIIYLLFKLNFYRTGRFLFSKLI